MRLKTSHVAFVKINNNEVKTETLEVVNMSEKPVTIDFSMCRTILNLRQTLKTLQGMKSGEEHGEKGYYYHYLRMQKQKMITVLLLTECILFLMEKKTTRNRLSVSATIEEDFFSSYSGRTCQCSQS